MSNRVLIVGGGIGGLAAALACARQGASVELFERSGALTEFGAGLQLGPNVVKLLQGWGLNQALLRAGALPDRLQVRNAVSGAELGVLRLGDVVRRRYGAPYLTMHRADLQSLLADALRLQSKVKIHLGAEVVRLDNRADGVRLYTSDDQAVDGDLLVGADGLWSRVRQQLLDDGQPSLTGQLAYRALVAQTSLPEHLRSEQITAWLGPDWHVVEYPVRGGNWLNVVAVVRGQMFGDPQYWDHSGNGPRLRDQLAQACAPLQELIHAISAWRLWALNIRPPMAGAHQHAQGRVALLGDAAHPMVPFLAQGAGMAIEDAHALAQALRGEGVDVPQALANYATGRWRRNARVQARSLRNGRIFHATGWTRLGRDLSIKLLGERLLDLPWLYRGAPGS